MSTTATKSSQAYDAIEQMIIFQVVTPGSLVTEADLMTMTGIGRTPLREALQRLASDRLVELSPRRGILIPAISVESQLSLLEIRRPLEELAVSLAARRRSPGQGRQAHILADELLLAPTSDLHSFERLLRHGHELVVDAAHNEYIHGALAPLQGLSRRYWFASLREADTSIADAARHHHAILRAVSDGDAERAAFASLQLNDYLTQHAHSSIRR
jgi:DNA-binding GntR family transcriptional regulator